MAGAARLCHGRSRKDRREPVLGADLYPQRPPRAQREPRSSGGLLKEGAAAFCQQNISGRFSQQHSDISVCTRFCKLRDNAGTLSVIQKEPCCLSWDELPRNTNIHQRSLNK